MEAARSELDQTLLRLIREQAIGDQSALRSRLAAAGIQVSQPTLSRHLARLGIAKREGRYQPPLVSGPRVSAIHAAPPNLVVLRTEPGFANALAAVLDQSPLPGQVATVAGDDTVLLVLGEAGDLSTLLHAARALRG